MSAETRALGEGCEILATRAIRASYEPAAAALLHEYLSPRGLSVDEHIRPVLDGVQYAVDAAYVTGSVVVGFGNATSDIDLYVVVSEPAAEVPMPTFGENYRVDVRHYQADALWFDDMEAPTVPPGFSEWRDQRRAHALLGRLITGLSIVEPSARLADWSLPDHDDVQRWQQHWWSLEVLRRLAILELTPAEARPQLAQQRLVDVVIALCEVMCCSYGELYFSPKWTGAKLRRIDQPDAERLLLSALAGEAPAETATEVSSTHGTPEQERTRTGPRNGPAIRRRDRPGSGRTSGA